MTKVMLVTGMIVAYGYANEAFFAWYSANPYEQYMMYNRMTGPYAVFYWSLIAINAAMIQLFWFRRVRDNLPLLFVLSLLVNVGMWLERFIIIVTSLHRDFLPSSWGMYAPTRWDFRCSSGRSGSSSRSSSCSSACCRPSRCSRCGRWCPRRSSRGAPRVR
jgi:hypothetical protein